MGVLILLFGLIAAGIIAIAKTDSLSGARIISEIITTVFVIITIIYSVCVITHKSYHAEKIANYHQFKTDLEYARQNSDSVELSGVFLRINNINSKIVENKLYHNNFWTGIFYSKEYGELPFIK